MTRYGKRGYLIVPEEEPFNAALAALAENPRTSRPGMTGAYQRSRRPDEPGA